jgi:hypothetical protein
MDPTLTLQIPFVFLFRRRDPDIENKWTPEEQDAEATRNLHTSLGYCCPNITVHLGISQT